MEKTAIGSGRDARDSGGTFRITEQSLAAYSINSWIQRQGEML